jgi:4-hydroxy-3-polyprenylbenzoate decarboxylase
VKQAGAVVLFLAPGFYHGSESVSDLVDFIVGRCLDQLGLEHGLVRRWGEG